MDVIYVGDPTDVADARRRIGGLTACLGYDETASGRVAIVVTELAQNLMRHAGGGEILARADPEWAGGIEIMALDRGPGMADVAACLRDGYSTGGTSGNGLGAIQRLARQMLFHSRPQAGTAVLVRMGRESGGDPGAPRTTAALCVPKMGETVCGDTAAILAQPGAVVGIMLADGLGHGPQAAAASGEAARLFMKRGEASPKASLSTLHAGLRATRGAAVAIASIDPTAREVTYSGIGNIAGFITDSGGVRRMVSHSGTAGHTAGRLQDFRYPLHNRPVLVMYSDGLATSWSPESHPGLFGLDPLLIAGVLYRDHARGRDDASVVVWKG
ncbi:MAG TPA: SpoIIE family protein phosphatase [Rhodopila sp.]|jgi:anti-sigma regulatory factor (Ser/Thr protein kinase)|nr:SpoIIE family protein phosphatase [Rhodopila sp.]